MLRLEQKLNEMDSNRLEDFFSWLEHGDWTDRGIVSVKIKGPRRISSIAISEPLLEVVRAQMTEQGVKSLSGLIEMLLWNYAGQDPELVERHKPKRKSRMETNAED